MNKKSKLFLTMLFCCQLANILSFAYAEEKWEILNLKPQYIEGGYELCSGSERVADITWDTDSCIPGRCNIGSVNVAEKYRGLKLSTELYRAATVGCNSVYSIHVKDNFTIWQQAMLKTGGDKLRSVSCTPEGQSLARLYYYPIKCDIYDKNTAVTYISSAPPRPSVTGCTTPRLSGSSRITSTYSQWLNSSASQCSAGQGLRGAQCALNFVQMMNPYLAPCVDTFQNEVLTGIDELDPTESKFFSNSVCQITGGIGLGYGLGAAASTCAEFGGVTNTICLSVGATELGAPLAAVGGTAVCAGACVYVAGHGAVNCYNHSPSQGYVPEYGYSTGYFDNACDIYGDLLPEGPSWDDYAKSNFIEELLSYIPSSGPVRRPVCREKRDPITGRMGVDCRR